MKREDIVIKLDYPSTFDGEERSELTFRRPTAHDIIICQDDSKPNGEDSTKLLCLCAGISPEDLGKIDGADYMYIVSRVQEIVGKRITTFTM